MTAPIAAEVARHVAKAGPGRSARTSLIRALTTAAPTDVSNQPLTSTPHGFRRLLITEAIRTGLPAHIAAVICGHQVLDTTMGSAAIHSDDVIAHHRAFSALSRGWSAVQQCR
ncbi:hypothetical protein ACWGDS_31080 [Streptomyces sp. NPDC055059]